MKMIGTHAVRVAKVIEWGFFLQKCRSAFLGTPRAKDLYNGASQTKLVTFMLYAEPIQYRYENLIWQTSLQLLQDLDLSLHS
jgi:hypothetical protein